MHVHIARTVQVCFFQLWQRVTPRTYSSLAPYQHVIAAAVRLIINGVRLFDQVTSAVHWLPVPAEARIQEKMSPPRRHVMQLCGRQTTDSLFVPCTRLLSGNERAFRVAAAAPKAWNQLPRDVHCGKQFTL